MAEQFLFQQFIYGKYAGASRTASYTTLAKSSGLTDEYIKQIRKAFNGCRPDSTDLSSYKTSYAITSIEDVDLALLRLDVIEDSGLGNNYILYERYVVVKKEVIKKHNLKPLLILKMLPDPETLTESKMLSDSVDVEKIFISDPVDFNGIKKEQDVFLPTLYCLLISRPVLIFSQKTLIDWEWLVSLDDITPKHCTMNLRVFLGSSKTKDWQPDLEVRFDARSQQNFRVVDPQDVNLENLSEGYTDFLRRCVENNAVELFAKTLLWSDTVNFERKHDNFSYDSLLKKEILPDLRLELIRSEFKNGKNVEKELYWLWKNASFDFEDIENFLPLLLLSTINKWGKEDFLLFSDYLKKFGWRKISLVLENDRLLNSTRSSFLMQWGQVATSLSPDKDLPVWVNLLSYLVKQDLDISCGAFARFLGFVDLSNYKDVKKILKLFPKNISLKSFSVFWIFVSWLFSHVKKVDDIKICADILSSIDTLPESRNLLAYLNYLLQQTSAGDSGVDIARQVIVDVDSSQAIAAISPHLVNVTLISDYPKALLSLAIALKNFKFLWSGYNLQNNAFAPNINVLTLFYEIVLADVDEKYISAYIFFLCRFSSKETVKNAVTDILMKSVDMFHKVVDFSLITLDIDKGCLELSESKLRVLKEETQLNLLMNYFISAEKVNQALPKTFLLEHALSNVNSLEIIDHAVLEKFLSLLLKYNERLAARMVLEHQIRTSRLRGNPKAADDYLKRLFRLISHDRKISSKDLVKKKMVVSYLRDLPDEYLKEFVNWLFHLSFSSDPFLKKAHLQPLTSNFLSKHPDWFTNDGFVRYCLFEELLTWEWK